mgnify:FL=1
MEPIVTDYNALFFLYDSALREVNTKIEILNNEFKSVHKYNPIEHIKMRIKSMQSIMDKLERKNIPYSFDNVMANINDIAGIRVICSFTSDIYKIAKMLASQNDMNVLEIKDYIKNPKPSGYRSLHMLVEVPVFFSERMMNLRMEIQIRTIAMDFWASLEHKMHYKFKGNAPYHIEKDLQDCAEIISALDEKMLKINEEINLI